MYVDDRMRCFGNKANQALYAAYHDTEWGRPLYDDDRLFAQLCLEGAQAGLSWETILKKREAYDQAFHHFSVKHVAQMTDDDLYNAMDRFAIVRHRLKIFSVRRNAEAVLSIQHDHGSFSWYVWGFVGGVVRKGHWHAWSDVPAYTAESIALSKGLKGYGMQYVGKTIVYAFMQASGLVDDHLISCWCYTP